MVAHFLCSFLLKWRDNMLSLTEKKELELHLLSLTGGNIIEIDSVRTAMVLGMRKHYLEQHKAKIWQGTGADTRWKTHLPPDNKLIRKATLEELNDAIVAHYSGLEKAKKDNRRTMKTTFEEWFQYKMNTCKASSTARRVHNDWVKYYVGTKIIDVPLNDFNSKMLKQWATELIVGENLTKSQYSNLRVIMRQMLDYCLEQDYIQKNPFLQVSIDKNSYRVPEPHEASTQVFIMEEPKKIVQIAYQDYLDTNSGLALAIEFLFLTGLRIGELIALKFKDIQNDTLKVHCMEQKVQKFENKTWKHNYVITIGRTKTQTSTRTIPLVPRAKELLKLIKEANDLNGYQDNDYIFVNEKGRVHTRAIDYRLRKYCKKAGIPEKSLHKIRKTFASTLLDKGISVVDIKEVMGHSTFQTTEKYYLYSLTNQEKKKQQFSKALSY